MAKMVMRTRLNGTLYASFPRYHLETELGEIRTLFWMLWRKGTPLPASYLTCTAHNGAQII